MPPLDAIARHVAELTRPDFAEDVIVKHLPSTHDISKIGLHLTGRRRMRKMLRKEINKLYGHMTWLALICSMAGALIGMGSIALFEWYKRFKQ